VFNQKVCIIVDNSKVQDYTRFNVGVDMNFTNLGKWLASCLLRSFVRFIRGGG